MKLHYKHTLYASYLGYITQAIINNLAPLLFFTFQKSFSISLKQIGLLVSVNFIIQMIVDFFCAKFIDKIGYRISAVAAHVFCTIGLISMACFPFLFSNAYYGLLAAVVINGIGGGLIEVLISPIVESLPGDEKSADMSLLHSFYCWGSVSVVLFSSLFFVTIGIDRWYYLPVFWAIVPLLNALLFSKVPLCTLVEESNLLPVRKLVRMKIFWMFIVLMICAGAAEQAVSQWVSLLAEAGLGISKMTGDLLGPCSFAVLMGLSRLFYGKKGYKINLHKFIFYSGILCIISYGIIIFSPIPLISMIGCSLCGLSVGILWPGTFSLTSRYIPYGGTAMFAFLALAGDIGCSAGPSTVGFISNLAEKGKLTLNVLFINEVGTESYLKTGLLFSMVFPIILLITISYLLISKSGKTPVEES